MLSIKDRKLLLELEQDARASLKSLGKKIGCSSDNVKYRLDLLQKKEVIHALLTFVDCARLGFTDYGLYITTADMPPQQEAEFIARVKKHDHVQYFGRHGGTYDFIISILAYDMHHLDSMMSALLNPIAAFIVEKTVIPRVGLSHFPRAYLGKTPASTLPGFGGTVSHESLDEIDHKILTHLSQDARLPLTELGKKTKIPISTLSSRIRALQALGIINGFFAWISPISYGRSIFNVLLSTSHLTASDERKLKVYCQQSKNVSILIKTVGKWDYELIIEVEEQQELQKFIQGLRSLLGPAFLGSELLPNFKEYKYVLYPFQKNPSLR